ncbi:MAG: hypothetical protein GXP61_02760 [Epsilonproteobacteria bacterium]|nr:hypothetical protein [Campylobacterota bacterium]
MRQMAYDFDKYITAEDGSAFITVGFAFKDGMHSEVKTLHECLASNRYIVMDFMGCKDINGIKIYEKDIVQHVKCCGKHGRHDDGDISVVKFCNNKVRPFGDNMQGDTYQNPCNYEVLGNNLEDSDLIKTKK